MRFWNLDVKWDRFGLLSCEASVRGQEVEHSFENKLAGVLVPVFALRGEGDQGIGDVGALKEVVSWAARHRIRAVQVLPVNEPGSDHSPYNLLSAMALDPLTIDTRSGQLPGLTEGAVAEVLDQYPLGSDSARVDYPVVSKRKWALLEAAFSKFRRNTAFKAFEAEHKEWIQPYSLFRALVELNGGSEVVDDWPKKHRSFEAATDWVAGLSTRKRKEFEKRQRFFIYVQWVAATQWGALRAFAESVGVSLVGDVPVGVSLFSADVWRWPDQFDLVRSSGAPPEKVFQTDPFTAQWGQNWGFPLYDWQAMKDDGYRWWRQRLRWLLSIFHCLRVDHALGFFRIYSFPWRPQDNEKFTDLTEEEASRITGGPLPGFVPNDDETEENRAANRSHGEAILRMFLEESGTGRILAEDLGEVAPYVPPTLSELSIPGFKIPQWERSWDRLTPGVSYPRESVTTFATHDHPPMKTAWEEIVAKTDDEETRDDAIHTLWEYMDFCAVPGTRLPQPYTEEIHHALVRGLLLSNSWLAVHMITDLFGSDLRFNVPGSASDDNWSARLPEKVSEWDTTYAKPIRVLEDAICETGR